MGIYKRKQESKKKQENKNSTKNVIKKKESFFSFSWSLSWSSSCFLDRFLGRVLVLLFSYFLVFFYKFPPLIGKQCRTFGEVKSKGGVRKLRGGLNDEQVKESRNSMIEELFKRRKEGVN